MRRVSVHCFQRSIDGLREEEDVHASISRNDDARMRAVFPAAQLFNNRQRPDSSIPSSADNATFASSSSSSSSLRENDLRGKKTRDSCTFLFSWILIKFSSRYCRPTFVFDKILDIRGIGGTDKTEVFNKIEGVEEKLLNRYRSISSISRI